MEEWKYDVWVAEWEAMYGGTPSIAATSTSSSSIMDTVSVSPETSKVVETDAGMEVSSTHETALETVSEHSTTAPMVKTDDDDAHTPTLSPSAVDSPPKTVQSVPEHTTMQATQIDPYSQAPTNQSTKDSSQPLIDPTDYPNDFILIDTSHGTTPDSSYSSTPNHGSNGTKTKTTKVIATTTTSVVVAPTAPGGESVYRMILNRLSNLEGNQTLYARYIEDQARSANDRLRILEEEVGRLGALVSSFTPLMQGTELENVPQTKTQQQTFTKLLERHRLDQEMELNKITSRIDALAHEVGTPTLTTC